MGLTPYYGALASTYNNRGGSLDLGIHFQTSYLFLNLLMMRLYGSRSLNNLDRIEIS